GPADGALLPGLSPLQRASGPSPVLQGGASLFPPAIVLLAVALHGGVDAGDDVTSRPLGPGRLLAAPQCLVPFAVGPPDGVVGLVPALGLAPVREQVGIPA